MFSWPAYYSDLSSLHPLSEELELELLRIISQNAIEQHLQIKGGKKNLLNKNRFRLSPSVYFVSSLLVHLHFE